MDDLERQLRELGETAEREIGVATGTVDTGRLARRARLRKGVALLGSLGLLAVAAVGGYVALRPGPGGSGVVDESVLAAAARATQSEGTARVEFEMVMRSDGGFFGEGGEFTTRGSGEIDFAADRQHIRFEMEDISTVRSLEMIRDGATIYTKDLQGQDAWVKTDVSDFGGLSSGLATQDLDPDDYLGYLESVSSDVTLIGQEELDGVPVTHYRATIDPELALPNLEGVGDNEMLEAVDLKFDPAEAWVDSDGRVRQMTFGTSVDSGGLLQMAFDMDFTMRLFDFGVPVDIEIPEAADIAEGISIDSEDTDRVKGNMNILMGDGGISQPNLTIMTGPFRMACVLNSPDWATRAAVIDRSTGAIYFESELTEMPFPSGIEGSGGCLSSDSLPTQIKPLIQNPDRYSLRLSGDGQELIIDFTSMRSF